MMNSHLLVHPLAVWPGIDADARHMEHTDMSMFHPDRVIWVEAVNPRRRGSRQDAERPRSGLVRSGRLLVRPPKTAESLARRIVHELVEQNARPGDRLATEAAMVSQWGVSRHSVREALRLLEMQGVVSIQRGFNGGPVVEQVDSAFLGRTASLFFHLAGATQDELLGALLLCEANLAELAARNPDGFERRRAMAPFVAHETPMYGELIGFDGHGAFHSIVASLSGNTVLETMLSAPGTIFWSNINAKQLPTTPRDVLTKQHGEIAEAIASGRPRRARELMQIHINHLGDHYREQAHFDSSALVEWS
jgi:DNA-binding FadR family transcriptional regulator